MEVATSPLVSFAIPTYNFGNFIAETVESITKGAEILRWDQFEIVILDGGSTDNTERVVLGLVRKFPNIRYTRQSARGGIDRDMDKVASSTRGKYIWLFSADDVLQRGWDRLLLPTLVSEKSDIVLVPAVLCDLQMATLRKNPIFRADTNGAVEFRFTPEGGTVESYLRAAVTLEAVFSYMSSIIVKAEVWRGLRTRADFFGSCWAHCAKLMPLLFMRTTFTYLNLFLIRKRSGNDSFMANGLIARIGIAVDGWDRIIQEFFTDSAQQELLYAALRRDMPIPLFIYAKISARNRVELQRLNGIARLLYTERSVSKSAMRKYFVFRLIPASATLNLLLKPILPAIIRARHMVRAALG
mgnify:CR=1 FL=1